MLRRNDVTPPRSVRKTIFSYNSRLWRSLWQRERALLQGLPESRARHSSRRSPAFSTSAPSPTSSTIYLMCDETDRLILSLAETWHDAGCVELGNGRFPDNCVPDSSIISRTRRFPDNHFPGQTFPGPVSYTHLTLPTILRV